jgi:hypothetical protein
MKTKKRRKSETVVNLDVRESTPEWREWTGRPMELILSFADGHVEHAEHVGRGFNNVMVCETGIFIISGKLLNKIEVAHGQENHQEEKEDQEKTRQAS